MIKIYKSLRREILKFMSIKKGPNLQNHKYYKNYIRFQGKLIHRNNDKFGLKEPSKLLLKLIKEVEQKCQNCN